MMTGKLLRWTFLPVLMCSVGASSVRWCLWFLGLWFQCLTPSPTPPKWETPIFCLVAVIMEGRLVGIVAFLLCHRIELFEKACLLKLLKMKFFYSLEKIQIRSIRLWIGCMPSAECVLCSRDCSKYFYIHYLITFPCQLNYCRRLWGPERLNNRHKVTLLVKAESRFKSHRLIGGQLSSCGFLSP